MDPRVQLAKKVREFVHETIRGHELGFYKMRIVFPFKLNTEDAKGLIPSVAINYFNVVYEALVSEEDEFVNEKFGEMQKIMKHSPVCLINMVFMLTVRFHTKMDRTKFNMDSYEKYMESVLKEFEKIMPSAEMLAPAFGHKCAGPEKAPALKLGEKMFYGMPKK